MSGMRLVKAALNDMLYQVRYGLYFLRLIVSIFYTTVLRLIPTDIRRGIAAVIILTDPAALGFIFIGAILLLEQGEGLHSYLSVLPLRTDEYVCTKALSLSMISVLSGLVVAAAGLRGGVNYLLLLMALMVGSTVFTFAG
ncbi:MAG: ABC transporter, partial [Firmicutes bacterium]|nr:ABC transporter [Bacillota bacterium]